MRDHAASGVVVDRVAIDAEESCNLVRSHDVAFGFRGRERRRRGNGLDRRRALELPLEEGDGAAQ
jgi:hypothetical protein